MPLRFRATTRAISPQSAGRGTGAGRGHPNQRCRKGGHSPFDAFATGQTNQAARSDRLCASRQLPRVTTTAPGLPGVYPSAVFAAHTAVHDGDPGAYRNATGGGTLVEETGTAVKLPSYNQVRTAVQHLKMEPELVAMREGAKSVPRARESAESFVLSIPAPALLTQVDEHTMDLYVVTPDGETVASRVHAAVLICVKTAAILGAVLALGPLKEEDYMRLVKVSLERKDHLVGINWM